MIHFTKDEKMLIVIYNPGSREDLIQELQKMQKSLTARDRNLRRWTGSLPEKLSVIFDIEFDALELFSD